MREPNAYVIELVDQVLAEMGYDWRIFYKPYGKRMSLAIDLVAARARVWSACRSRTTRHGCVPSWKELAFACIGRDSAHATVIEAVARLRRGTPGACAKGTGTECGRILERGPVAQHDGGSGAATGVGMDAENTTPVRKSAHP